MLVLDQLLGLSNWRLAQIAKIATTVNTAAIPSTTSAAIRLAGQRGEATGSGVSVVTTVRPRFRLDPSARSAK